MTASAWSDLTFVLGPDDTLQVSAQMHPDLSAGIARPRARPHSLTIRTAIYNKMTVTGTLAQLVALVDDMKAALTVAQEQERLATAQRRAKS